MMFLRLLLIVVCFLSGAAHAEPSDMAVNSPMEFPILSAQEAYGELGNPFVEELEHFQKYRAQSRAVELLGSEFSRAAAQGLIEAQSSPSQTMGTVLSDTLDERSNLSVVTGIDRDSLITSIVPPTASGAVCLSEREVDLSNWGDPSDPRLLGNLRTQAIAEDGELTDEGALRMARFYIVLGFGAEAKALTAYIKSPSDREIIQALANILDAGRSDSEIFRGQIFCDGSVSLWAALAESISEDEIPTNTNQILTTFSGLPIHLRSHLGPLLAERLRDVGLADEARNVLNAMTRGGTQTIENTLVEARLGLTGTQSDLARKKLESLSSGTGITAAEALLELLEDADRRQIPPSVSWVEDVPSLVRATQGTPVSLNLNLAGLNGMISLKRFDAVRLALSQDGPGLTETTRQKLAVKALAGATEHATDEEFLRSVIGFEKYFLKEELARGARLAIAKRLSDLGLAKRAVSYLPEQPDTVEERRVASDVLSAAGEISAAIDVIEEAPQDLLAELAELLSKQGDIERALSSFSESGRDDAATLLAIQSGTWNWVAQNGLDTASQASASLLNSIDMQASEASNGPLLEHTQTRRQQARRLLNMLDSEELSGAFIN